MKVIILQKLISQKTVKSFLPGLMRTFLSFSLSLFLGCLFVQPVFADQADDINNIRTNLGTYSSVANNGYGSILYNVNLTRTYLNTLNSNLSSYLYFNNKGAARWISDVYDRLNTVNSSITSGNTSLSNISSSLSSTVNGLPKIYSSIDELEGFSRNLYSRLGDVLSSLQSSEDFLDSSSSSLESLVSLFTPSSSFSTRDLSLYINNTAGNQLLPIIYSSSYHPLALTMLPEGSYNTTISPFPTSFFSFLDIINSNIFMSSQKLYNNNKLYYAKQFDYSSFSTRSYQVTSVMDLLRFTSDSIVESVGRLAGLYASDDVLESRQLQSDLEDQVLQDFVDPSSDSALNLRDSGFLSGGVKSLKRGFTSGADPDDTFQVLDSSSNIYDWFSSDVKNSLDSTNNRSRLYNSYSSTPLLNQYYREVFGELDVSD